ncbi:hypothetical protein L596_001264 [Steinernema carpocapsae]|uniref:Uncharacterized protein n=1 Tax=Steinernema carpocapsae TaxID=34508 RepID=A0A4V6I720_STECR|nr:hypothetical protein L596_001264 [Steinernema carpocapsae]
MHFVENRFTMSLSVRFATELRLISPSSNRASGPSIVFRSKFLVIVSLVCFAETFKGNGNRSTNTEHLPLLQNEKTRQEPSMVMEEAKLTAGNSIHKLTFSHFCSGIIVIIRNN